MRHVVGFLPVEVSRWKKTPTSSDWDSFSEKITFTFGSLKALDIELTKARDQISLKVHVRYILIFVYPALSCKHHLSKFI